MTDIQKFNQAQPAVYKAICLRLNKEIDANLKKSESKLWHGGPVWFIDENPIVGYDVRKKGVQLLFWSGMSFDEEVIQPIGNVVKFKAGGIVYTNAKEIDAKILKRLLKKSEKIQWDYKNIVKRKGKLVRLK